MYRYAAIREMSGTCKQLYFEEMEEEEESEQVGGGGIRACTERSHLIFAIFLPAGKKFKER